MAKHKYLSAINKQLGKLYSFTFKHDNVLELALKPGQLPVAYLIVESEAYDCIILSLSADFHNQNVVAELVINLMHLAPIKLSENFYYDRNGNNHWGDEALDKYQLESDPMLMELMPLTDTKH